MEMRHMQRAKSSVYIYHCWEQHNPQDRSIQQQIVFIMSGTYRQHELCYFMTERQQPGYPEAKI